MIRGIGLDLVELNRIEKMMLRTEKIQQRILTSRELAIFEPLSPSRAPHAASPRTKRSS